MQLSFDISNQVESASFSVFPKTVKAVGAVDKSLLYPSPHRAWPPMANGIAPHKEASISADDFKQLSEDADSVMLAADKLHADIIASAAIRKKGACHMSQIDFSTCIDDDCDEFAEFQSAPIQETLLKSSDFVEMTQKVDPSNLDKTCCLSTSPLHKPSAYSCGSLFENTDKSACSSKSNTKFDDKISSSRLPKPCEIYRDMAVDFAHDADELKNKHSKSQQVSDTCQAWLKSVCNTGTQDTTLKLSIGFPSSSNATPAGISKSVIRNSEKNPRCGLEPVIPEPDNLIRKSKYESFSHEQQVSVYCSDSDPKSNTVNDSLNNCKADESDFGEFTDFQSAASDIVCSDAKWALIEAQNHDRNDEVYNGRTESQDKKTSNFEFYTNDKAAASSSRDLLSFEAACSNKSLPATAVHSFVSNASSRTVEQKTDAFWFVKELSASFHFMNQSISTSDSLLQTPPEPVEDVLTTFKDLNIQKTTEKSWTLNNIYKTLENSFSESVHIAGSKLREDDARCESANEISRDSNLSLHSRADIGSKRKDPVQHKEPTLKSNSNLLNITPPAYSKEYCNTSKWPLDNESENESVNLSENSRNFGLSRELTIADTSKTTEEFCWAQPPMFPPPDPTNGHIITGTSGYEKEPNYIETNPTMQNFTISANSVLPSLSSVVSRLSRFEVAENWLRMLLKAIAMIETASLVLGNERSVLAEVLNTHKGRRYVKCLLEVYNVTQQVKKASELFGVKGLQETFRQIDAAWKSRLEDICVSLDLNVICVDHLNKKPSPSCEVCAICLLPLALRPRLLFGDHAYHATCGNFWVNVLAEGLPCLKLE